MTWRGKSARLALPVWCVRTRPRAGCVAIAARVRPIWSMSFCFLVPDLFLSLRHRSIPVPGFSFFGVFVITGEEGQPAGRLQLKNVL